MLAVQMLSLVRRQPMPNKQLSKHLSRCFLLASQSFGHVGQAGKCAWCWACRQEYQHQNLYWSAVVVNRCVQVVAEQRVDHLQIGVRMIGCLTSDCPYCPVAAIVHTMACCTQRQLLLSQYSKHTSGSACSIDTVHSVLRACICIKVYSAEEGKSLR